MPRQNPHQNVVLNPSDAARQASWRIPPPDDLAGLVQWFWVAAWDLREQPAHTVEILTDTAFHLVFEPSGANVVGVVTRKFTRCLQGQDRVLGVKFRSAGFRPFTTRSARDFMDKRVPLDFAFDVDTPALTRHVLQPSADAERAARAAEFLRERLPPPDGNVALLQAMVLRIEAHPELIEVGQLAHEFDVNVRRLQRLFREYLGVSPKWVIRRARLLEAAERIREGQVSSFAQLAAALGYFDQSHFARDFKQIVGCSPIDYDRSRRAREA
jgi:AraC-like DNA-binding protein